MSSIEYPPMSYNELASFIKQRLWNNKSIVLEITREVVDEQTLNVKIIKNERDNIK
jgi:hypothetical protein